jgi:hypothetical protein
MAPPLVGPSGGFAQVDATTPYHGLCVDGSLVSSIGQTFSQIGHVDLTRGNDSFTHRAFLVVNGTGVVFLPTRGG